MPFDDASVRLINNQNQWFVALKRVKTIILFLTNNNQCNDLVT